jgi:PDZ domain-containing protein
VGASRHLGDHPHGVVALLAAGIAIFAILLLSVPYYSIAPGPAEDVFRLIEIDGASTTRANGRLLLTTVSLQEIQVADMIRSWFDDSYEIVSRSAVVPPGETDEDAARRTLEQMDESQLLASAAALKFLGYDVPVTNSGVRVQNVLQDTPAAASLERGDVIVGVDGRSITKIEEFVADINRHKVGDDVVLEVLRGDRKVSVKTKTVGRPENPVEPIIGIEPGDVAQPNLPLAIEIESLGIGGPSAGLMYALGVVDLLDQRDLVSGRTIAGAGEISIDGTVTPVGGIRQKIDGAKHVGAEIFLVPDGQRGEACRVAGDLRVVVVNSLEQAVKKLSGAELGTEC